MTKINISIPEPCHENWKGMTPENKGRFCSSCQKKVFDFTSSSDREIINAFEKNNNLCGRFLNTQLNRDLVKPKEKSSLWLATTTALISLIGFNEATAQQKAPTEQTDRRTLGKFMVTPAKEKIVVTGNVFNSEGDTLSEVLIQVEKKDIVIYTDDNGYFTANITKGDVLLFSKKSYETQKVRFREEMGHLNINLYESIAVTKTSHITMGGIGSIIVTKRRTFFGRIFYAIGNWFR